MSFFSPENVTKRTQRASRELDADARSKKVKNELDMAAKEKATMKEEIEHLNNLIGLVANQEYADATVLTHDLLTQRITGALNDYKQTVARNLFVPSESMNQEGR